MAQARQANRAVLQFAIHPIIAVVAAALFAGVLAVAALDPFGLLQTNSPGAYQVDPDVIQAGRQWELERKAQSGYTDPVLGSGRDWELQRKQQSPESE